MAVTEPHPLVPLGFHGGFKPPPWVRLPARAPPSTGGELREIRTRRCSNPLVAEQLGSRAGIEVPSKSSGNLFSSFGYFEVRPYLKGSVPSTVPSPATEVATPRSIQEVTRGNQMIMVENRGKPGDTLVRNSRVWSAFDQPKLDGPGSTGGSSTWHPRRQGPLWSKFDLTSRPAPPKFFPSYGGRSLPPYFDEGGG